MKDTRYKKQGTEGFTLFVAMVVMGTLLLISTGLVSLAVRQAQISTSSRESQHAFYAADTGMECAIFWDVNNPDPGGVSAFATTTGTSISCNEDTSNPVNPYPKIVGGSSESQFTLTFLPDSYCAVVTIAKNPDGTTIIDSLGYNTCDPASARRVERAVRASY